MFTGVSMILSLFENWNVITRKDEVTTVNNRLYGQKQRCCTANGSSKCSKLDVLLKLLVVLDCLLIPRSKSRAIETLWQGISISKRKRIKILV